MSALLEAPQAVAADANGTIYIADSGNNVIRKISKGIITTLGGVTGYVYDLKLDAAGNLYIAGGVRLFKITPAGVVSSIAGNGSAGTFTGDGGPATSAGFSGIEAVAIDGGGNIFICDTLNNRIREVTPDGIVRTIAGGGPGYAGDNGLAAGALFNNPNSIATDAAGNLYINDFNNNRVRKITLDGNVNTIAGNGVCCNSPDGGLATAAYIFTGPLTTDTLGNVYVFDYLTNRIRKVTPGGILQAFAGDGHEGFAGDGGTATNARFSDVTGLGTDSSNNVYIVDANNERIRRVDAGGTINTIAGRGHFAGDGGPASAALLHRPFGVVTGTDGSTYFTDTVNHRVRKIAPDGTISTIAGTGNPGFSGDNGPAAQAALSYPDSIAIDGAGNLFVVDQSQLRVRKITPAGTISTVAGNGILAYSFDSSGALFSGFAYLTGIAVDGAGNVYLSEQLFNKIKKVTPTGGMTTYANSSGAQGFGGDGQPAAAAVFNSPGALAFNAAGDLFVADTLGYRVRKIAAGGGTVSTVAGNGDCCYNGDGGPAASARVYPDGMVADSNGGLWMTDPLGVRYIGRDGNINRISGGQVYGFGGDDATATIATEYNFPEGIALNSANEVVFADTNNSRIRKLQPNSAVRMDIVSGNNQNGTTGTALNPFIVKITGQTSVPPAYVNVSFAITAGTATLSATTSATDVNGQAGIAAAPTKAGTLTVTATAGSLSAIFTATVKDPITPPPADGPVISPGGIGQNGFSVPPVQTISTGAITTIYGTGFMAAGSAPQVNGVSGGSLATNFAGVCVTFGGVKAPIFGVAVSQVTVAVPTIAPGTVPVQVLRNCGTAGELPSNVVIASARTASPEFLYLVANANGANPVAAVGADGGFIGINGEVAKAGDILVVYALGLGATNPAQRDGIPAAGAATVTLPVSITIGGVALAPTDILYAGASPSYIGLYQVNVRVPAGVPSGKQAMVITVGTNQSPTGGYLTMQ